MAVVYRAQDMMLERPVAIKLLRQDYSNNENFREQFRREARAAANLSHPNIVTVHDFGYDAGRLFIVMEFVDGDDLKNVIRAKGRFTVPEAIHLMSQACAGIGYAHRAGQTAQYAGYTGPALKDDRFWHRPRPFFHQSGRKI